MVRLAAAPLGLAIAMFVTLAGVTGGTASVVVPVVYTCRLSSLASVRVRPAEVHSSGVTVSVAVSMTVFWSGVFPLMSVFKLMETEFAWDGGHSSAGRGAGATAEVTLAAAAGHRRVRLHGLAGQAGCAAGQIKAAAITAGALAAITGNAKARRNSIAANPACRLIGCEGVPVEGDRAAGHKESATVTVAAIAPIPWPPPPLPTEIEPP